MSHEQRDPLAFRELCEVYSVCMGEGGHQASHPALPRGQGSGSRMGFTLPWPGPDSTGENKGLFHSLSVERLPILGLTAGLVLKPDYPLGLGLSPA